MLKAKRRKRSHRTLTFLELWAGLYLFRSKKTGHPSSLKHRINCKCCFSLALRLNSSSNTTGLESGAEFLKCNTSFYHTDSCKVTIPREDDSSLFPGLAFPSSWRDQHHNNSSRCKSVFLISLCILICPRLLSDPALSRLHGKEVQSVLQSFHSFFDQMLHYFLKKFSSFFFNHTCSLQEP